MPDLDTRIAEIAEWFGRFDEGMTAAQIGKDDIEWLCYDVGPFLLAAIRAERTLCATLSKALEESHAFSATELKRLAALAPEQTDGTASEPSS